MYSIPFFFILFSCRYLQYMPFARILYYSKSIEVRKNNSKNFKLFFRCSLFLFIISLMNATIFKLSSLNLIFISICILFNLIDRKLFLKTALYGLEDILFANLTFVLNIYMIENQMGSSFGLSGIIGLALLGSIFVNAGWDKSLNSKDWRKGIGFFIFSSLPHYRLFKFTKLIRKVIFKISPIINWFEIFHQLFLYPLAILILIVFGLKIGIWIFLFISTLFLITLIYPYNLNPIGIWALLLAIITSISFYYSPYNKFYAILLFLISSYTVFGVNVFRFGVAKSLRLTLGLMKTGLFGGYHMHGLILITNKSKYNNFRSSDPNDRPYLKRFFVGNINWLSILRLLDVIERIDDNTSTNEDFALIEEIAKLYSPRNSKKNNLTLCLTQLDWNYKDMKYISQDFTMEVSTKLSKSLIKKIKSKKYLPFKTQRFASARSLYTTTFNKENALHAHKFPK